MQLKRRDFLKAMAAAGVGVAASGTGLTLLDPAGTVEASDEFSGKTLNVITQTGPYIASAVQDAMAPFKKATGANINLITAPFGNLYHDTIANFVTGGHAYDCILNPSSWLGDYAPHVLDLTKRIHHDKSLHWSDVIYQRNGQWAGKQVAMPLDGDNQLSYWRKDIIGNKSLQREYKKKTGKTLAPPATWDDFLSIARFFGDGKHGVYGVGEAYQHGGQAFWYYMSNCVAFCTAPGDPKGGLFFNPANLDPLVNDPGHLVGLQHYAECVHYGPPGMINWSSNDVRTQFEEGHCVLAIDWDDTPIVGELTPHSKVRGHIGSQLLPGTNKVWDYKKKRWIHTAKLNRPAWLAFGGWCGTIPKTSTNVNLAYKLLSLIASPAFSLKMVTGAATGMNPYRYSHFRDHAAWLKAGYPKDDLGAYLKAMETSDLDPHAVQDLRMPGAATFQDDTEVGTGLYVSGSSGAQAALNGVASKWNTYNNNIGHARQLKAYRESLNLGSV